MKTIYKTITVLIYHKEIHMYKDLLRDAQSLFHNRSSFLEIFTNYPTIGFYTIFSSLLFPLRAVRKEQKMLQHAVALQTYKNNFLYKII